MSVAWKREFPSLAAGASECQKKGVARWRPTTPPARQAAHVHSAGIASVHRHGGHELR
ncbi:hypothetical protein SLG_16670 [Sphingobium sp. SYK-6]|nr:hypothetical protein SLG_16670 [Sphingobium sp. SYK-6]